MDAILIHSGKERGESEGKALNFPFMLRFNPDLQLRAVGSDRVNKIADTSSSNKLSDRVRSSDSSGVEPLLLCDERSVMR